MQYGGEVQVCKDPWHAPLDNPVPTELETLRADLATKSRALADLQAKHEEALQMLHNRDEECDRLECNEIASANRCSALQTRLAEREAECEKLTKEVAAHWDQFRQGQHNVDVYLEGISRILADRDKQIASARELLQEIKTAADGGAVTREAAIILAALLAERDALRAQLLESQQDLREEEKRHRKAAVDRDEFAAKLHLADQDRQILSDCRAALRDILGEEHC